MIFTPFFGTTLRNLRFHINKINALPIRNRQNRLFIAGKCGTWAKGVGKVIDALRHLERKGEAVRKFERQSDAPRIQAHLNGTGWSTSTSLAFVNVCPVYESVHFPRITLQPSLDSVTCPVDISASSSPRVSMQSPSTSD